MRLSKEKILEIKLKMINKGVIFDNDNNFEYYLQNKHAGRYYSIINWMDKKQVKKTWSMLNLTYRCDVVIRRKISEILKPLEIQIRSWLLYFLEDKSITIDNLLNFENKDLYELIENFPDKKRGSIYRTRSFLSKILNPDNDNQKIEEVIKRMTFSPLIALVSLFNDENIKIIFHEKEDDIKKYEYMNIFYEVVGLRNYIAHHNIILNNKKIIYNRQEITINKVMKSLSLITRGDFSNKWNQEIKKYEERVVLQNTSNDSLSENDIRNLFEMISIELFGV